MVAGCVVVRDKERMVNDLVSRLTYRLIKLVNCFKPQCVAQVSWKKNKVPVTSHTTPGVVVSADKQMLHVARVKLHDAGLYQCAVTNKVGRKDQDFLVRVIGKNLLPFGIIDGNIYNIPVHLVYR